MIKVHKCFEMGFNKLKGFFFLHITLYSNICFDSSLTQKKNYAVSPILYNASAWNYTVGADITQKVQDILHGFLTKLRCEQKFSATNITSVLWWGCYPIFINEIFTLSWWASERFLQITRDRNQPSRRP